MKKENLKTALNLHPASGIQPYEASYKDFVKDYEWSDTTKSVPFHIDEAKWADSYFNTVLIPWRKRVLTSGGLTGSSGKNRSLPSGLSNTFWLNHVFFNHAKEKADNERPFIYHRWGGLGSHRYPLGFSGDTFITGDSPFPPLLHCYRIKRELRLLGTRHRRAYVQEETGSQRTLNFIYAGCSMVCSLRYSRLIPPKTVIS